MGSSEVGHKRADSRQRTMPYSIGLSTTLEKGSNMPIDPPDIEWSETLPRVGTETPRSLRPPDDFPNPNRPQEIWMNLRLDLEASIARLNDAIAILTKLEDYGKSKYLQEALVLQYSTLFALKSEY